jgi:hypothetical protein
MWGDYHLREAALYLQRIARDEPYYAFFAPVSSSSVADDDMCDQHPNANK